MQQWLAKGCVGPMIKLSHRLLYDVIIVKNGEVAFYNAFHFIARQLGFMFSLKQSYVNNNELYCMAAGAKGPLPIPLCTECIMLCSFWFTFLSYGGAQGMHILKLYLIQFPYNNSFIFIYVLQVLFKAHVGVLYQI